MKGRLFAAKLNLDANEYSSLVRFGLSRNQIDQKYAAGASVDRSPTILLASNLGASPSQTLNGGVLTKEQAEGLKKHIDENYLGMKSFLFAGLSHEGQCQVTMTGNMYELSFIERSIKQGIDKVMNGPPPTDKH